MSARTIFYAYERKILSAKETDKSFIIETPNSTKRHIYSKRGNFNQPVDVLLPSGKTRQVVFLQYLNDSHSLTRLWLILEVALRLAENGVAWSLRPADRDIARNIVFILHKDDKIYEEPKIAHDKGRSALLNECYFKWGEFSMKVHDGVRPEWSPDRVAFYPGGFHLTDICSQRVSEFPTNPFSDGTLALDRKEVALITKGWRHEPLYIHGDNGFYADKRAVEGFIFKRELVEKVFHPDRVARMIETYGMEWVDV